LNIERIGIYSSTKMTRTLFTYQSIKKLRNSFLELIFIFYLAYLNLCSFRSSVSAIKLGVIVLPLSPSGVLFHAEVEIRTYSCQDI
jgi:hypothetical protein